MKEIDPTAMEIIRYGMLQAAEEMKLKLMKTSIDTTIYVAKDFSCGVFNAKGELIAQSLGLPHFLANLGKSITSSAEDIGGFDKFEEGDVYMTNDPYRVVLHLPDIDVLMPLFYEGRLVGFTASRAHWADIGASEPMTVKAQEIYQEGVLFRSIRAYKDGKPIPDILRIIRENSRLPETSERNLRAQVAASLAGKARMVAVIDKYGVDSFLAALDGILKHGEEIARSQIRNIPDGEYSEEGYIDNDCVDLQTPVRIAVKVIVNGDSMTVDLTGSAERGKGCMNSGRVQTITECRMGFASLMPSGFPINEGIFKPLNVAIPSNSIFDADKPSATTLSYQAGDVVKDLMQVALAPVIPGGMCASNYGNACNLMITGYTPDKEYFFLVDVNAGGAGAKPFEDGENALIFGDLANVPVEVKEKKWPLRVERYQLRQNSEGPGKYRGGCGILEDTRFLGERGNLVTWIARYQVPTFGVLGGGSPPGNWAFINPDTPQEKDVPRVSGEPIKKGDLIRLVCGGGGGYGDPLERDPESVRLDVLDDLITKTRAREAYGVCFEEGPELQVDIEGTNSLRSQIKESRLEA